MVSDLFLKFIINRLWEVKEVREGEGRRGEWSFS